MELRGLSFNASSAVPASAGAASALGDALRAAAESGSPAMARVLALRGSEAVLDLLGHEVTAEAHTRLNVGDRLHVRVEQGANGAFRLAVQSSAPADGQTPRLADEALDEALNDAGLPGDERSRAVARALIARDGRLDRTDAQRLLTALRPFTRVGPAEASAAALLQRAGQPLTPALVATLAARAHPDGPPALAERLSAMLPGLQALGAGRGPASEAARALLATLSALPVGSSAREVETALGAWVSRLTPAGAATRSEPGKAGEETFRGVPPSQRAASPAGISYVNPAAGRGPDLAAALERAAHALGASSPELKQRLSEAVAEVRYVQLASGGAALMGREAAWLLPLLLPGQAGGFEEARLQVHREPAREGGEARDPGTRVELAVPTEHLATVQVEVVLHEGRLSLSLGLRDGADRAFVEAQLDGLREALAALGRPVDRLETRLATAPLPGLPQAEGLGEVLHFDRKV